MSKLTSWKYIKYVHVNKWMVIWPAKTLYLWNMMSYKPSLFHQWFLLSQIGFFLNQRVMLSRCLGFRIRKLDFESSNHVIVTWWISVWRENCLSPALPSNIHSSRVWVDCIHPWTQHRFTVWLNKHATCKSFFD